MSLRSPNWPRALPTDVVLALARVTPCGNIPFAPGTWGSLAGLAFFAVCLRPLAGVAGGVALALAVVALLALAVALCGEAEARLGKTDPGEVVLDEFAVMPLCFLGWWSGSPSGWPGWAVLLTGFLLFRLFDIWKPLGIKKLQRLPGGWGVVIDDVAAALAANAALRIAVALWPVLGGAG
jgi:phosphatidylglycerophosphatase A